MTYQIVRTEHEVVDDVQRGRTTDIPIGFPLNQWVMLISQRTKTAYPKHLSISVPGNAVGVTGPGFGCQVFPTFGALRLQWGDGGASHLLQFVDLRSSINLPPASFHEVSFMVTVAPTVSATLRATISPGHVENATPSNSNQLTAAAGVDVVTAAAGICPFARRVRCHYAMDPARTMEFEMEIFDIVPITLARIYYGPGYYTPAWGGDGWIELPPFANSISIRNRCNQSIFITMEQELSL